jgi:hypothetical protein
MDFVPGCLSILRISEINRNSSICKPGTRFSTALNYMKALKHTVRMVVGIGLVIVGIVGLILPVMPGWVFLIPGLLILGDYFPPIRRLVDWAKGHFAEANAQFRKSRHSDNDDSASIDADPKDHPETAGVAADRQET